MSEMMDIDGDDSDGVDRSGETLLGTPSYRVCVDLLRQLPSPGGSDTLLPKDVREHISQFLVIKRIQQRELSVSMVSSNQATLPVELILQKNPFAYWVSGFGSMPNGRGQEFIEFVVTKNNHATEPRRVRGVTIGIPSGPLSLREFRIDHAVPSARHGLKWVPGRILTTQEREGEQTFTLEEMDAYKLRLVCLSNHASSHGVSNEFLLSFNFVGIWTIAFI